MELSPQGSAEFIPSPPKGIRFRLKAGEFSPAFIIKEALNEKNNCH